jgi:fused signal recognition particle receptor
VVVVEVVGPVFKAGLLPRSLLWPSPGCGLAAAGLPAGLVMLEPELEPEPMVEPELEPEPMVEPEPEVAEGELDELPMLLLERPEPLD